MAGAKSLKDVTLRPWPPQEKEQQSQEDLLLQVHQLTTERGHLRDITEQSLQEDIAAGENGPGDVADSVEVTEKEKSVPSAHEIREKIFDAQKDMYSHLEYAPDNSSEIMIPFN